MEHFSNWLYATHLSTTIRETTWVVPAVQSVHIIAIAALFGSALISDLKLVGLFSHPEPLALVQRRYMPWLLGALAVLLATGLVMATGEPDRVARNWVFWTKMALVVLGLLTTLVLRRIMARAPDAAAAGLGSRMLALLSIAIWIAVILCGRWIAYVAS